MFLNFWYCVKGCDIIIDKIAFDQQYHDSISPRVNMITSPDDNFIIEKLSIRLDRVLDTRSWSLWGKGSWKICISSFNCAVFHIYEKVANISMNRIFIHVFDNRKKFFHDLKFYNSLWTGSATEPYILNISSAQKILNLQK